MRAGLVAAIATLVGCGGGTAPPPVKPIKMTVPVEAPKQVVEQPACIKQPEEAAAITHATADDATVSFCVGTAIDQCFSMELASGKLTNLPEAPQGQPRALEASARVETTNPELKVCTDAAGCKTLTPQVWPGAAPLRAATNGTVAAIMLGNAEAGKGYVDLYDVMKTKKLATVRFARGEFKCGDLAMLGETLYINTTVCHGTSGRAALYTTKGRKLANVGGKADFGTFGNAYTQVDGSTWAFLEENGDRIAVQDVAKGKVLKSINVSTLFGDTAGAAKMGNPGESAIVRLGNGKVAVIGGTPANGSVALVDLATSDVTVMPASMCP